MHHEENVSSQQTPAQKNARLSNSNENGKWSESHQSTAAKRPQKASGVIAYTVSDSKIGQWQGGASNLSQAKPTSKQFNLHKLNDADGLKVGGCPTQPEPIFESRAVYNFPKCARLLTKREFQRVREGGRRFVGKCLCIDFRPSPVNIARLGITASRRYGNSCERNRFKRLVREVFRKSSHLIAYELHIIPRQAAKRAQLSDIAADLHVFLEGV